MADMVFSLEEADELEEQEARRRALASMSGSPLDVMEPAMQPPTPPPEAPGVAMLRQAGQAAGRTREAFGGVERTLQQQEARQAQAERDAVTPTAPDVAQRVRERVQERRTGPRPTGGDPALRRAIDDAEGQRTKAGVLGLLGAVFAGGNPMPMQSHLQSADRSVAEARQMAAFEQDRQAREQAAQRQTMQDRQAQRRLDQQEMDAEQRRALQGEQVGIQRERLDLERERTESLMSLDEARRAAEGQDAAMQAQLRDPESQISRSLQAYLDEGMSILPRRPVTSETVRQMSGYEIMNAPGLQTLLSAGADKWRRDGGGGGGGAVGNLRQQMVQDMIELRGWDEERAQNYVAGLSTRDLRMAGRGAISGEWTEARQERREEHREERHTEQDVRSLSRDMQEAQSFRRATARALRELRGASDTELRAINMTAGVPPGMTPQRTQQLRSAISRVKNELIKERSGAAVTENEMSRIRDEVGDFRTSDPVVMRNWINTIAADASALVRTVRAGYSDDVIQAYESNLQREEGRRGGGEQRGGRRPIRHEDGRTGTAPQGASLPAGWSWVD